MNTDKQLNEACAYLVQKYKGMEDVISHLGKDPVISRIILNVYRFKNLENFGYSLEEIFMEVYVSLLSHARNYGHLPQNLTTFTQREIVKYFKDDLIDMSITSFMNSPGPIGLKLDNIQFREVGDYDFESEIDESSLSFVNHIIDRSYLEYLINKSYLKGVEKDTLRKYFIEDRNMTEIACMYQVSLTVVRNRIDKSLRKLRDVVRWLRYYFET